MDKRLAFFINTCDKFQDCWLPFFLLLKKQCPEFGYKVYLNTEKLDYSYDGIEILSTKTSPLRKNLTWSQHLKAGLEKVEEDYLIYLQEDYFFKSPLNLIELDKIFKEFLFADIDCLHLSKAGPSSFTHVEKNNFLEVAQFDSNRICCQAAIWKKSILNKYIRDHETAWDFEMFGSKRAAYYKDKIFSFNYLNNERIPVFDYVLTGVISGKWKPEVVDLFHDVGLNIDYSKRSFYYPQKRTLRKKLNDFSKKIIPNILFYFEFKCRLQKR